MALACALVVIFIEIVPEVALRTVSSINRTKQTFRITRNTEVREKSRDKLTIWACWITCRRV